MKKKQGQHEDTNAVVSSDADPTVRERLRRAVGRAGGPPAVARRIGMPYSTLNSYLNGREMPVGALVAIARACAVKVAWLAAGEGGEHAENYAPDYFPPLPEGSHSASGRRMDFPAAAEQKTVVAAPRKDAPDPAILAKAIEIIDALGSAIAPSERAKRIARTYEVLAAPEAELPPLAYHTPRPEG